MSGNRSKSTDEKLKYLGNWNGTLEKLSGTQRSVRGRAIKTGRKILTVKTWTRGRWLLFAPTLPWGSPWSFTWSWTVKFNGWFIRVTLKEQCFKHVFQSCFLLHLTTAVECFHQSKFICCKTCDLFHKLLDTIPTWNIVGWRLVLGFVR